jgi:N-acetylneuraminic acid mutarotase
MAPKALSLLAMLVTMEMARLDAQTGWKMAPPLPTPMGEIEGTAVGDKLYVMAGLNPATGRPIGAVYVFDASSNAWTTRNSMPVPAHHIMTAALNGKIYVFGGFVSPKEFAAWQPINNSWEYDPAADRWKALAPVPTPRGAGQAVLFGGKIYVIGGVHANVPGNPMTPLGNTTDTPQLVLGTVEEYDPATNEWRSRAPMPTARNHFLGAAVNGKIYAIAGRLSVVNVTRADATDIVEEYDPAKDRWVDKGRASIRRSGMAGGEYQGKIYLAGGEYQDREGLKAFWAVESFDPATNTWQTLPHMRVAHHGFAAGFMGSGFHVVGGGFQSDGMPGIDTKSAVHEVFQLGP